MKRLALIVVLLLSGCTTPDGRTWSIDSGALCWSYGEAGGMGCEQLAR